jgi:hypothetical protein
MNLALGCPVGDDIGDEKTGQQNQCQYQNQTGANGKKWHHCLSKGSVKLNRFGNEHSSQNYGLSVAGHPG